MAITMVRNMDRRCWWPVWIIKYMRNRSEFGRVLRNRHALQDAGLFSAPEGPGSRVALLMPFVDALVQDPRDDYQSFEDDAAELVRHYEANDRVPLVIMRATPDDFAGVMADATIPTVVIRGFGSLSQVAATLEKGDDTQYGHLDWLHLAKMATHLKLGEIIMRSCGGATRRFNAPLPVGIASSFNNILAPVGRAISVVGLDDEANNLIRPVTDSDELTYNEIREQFPLQRNREVTGSVPNGVYMTVRNIYNHTVNQAAIPDPLPIPYPPFQSNLV